MVSIVRWGAWLALAFFFAVLIGGLVSISDCSPDPAPARPDAAPLHDPHFVLAQEEAEALWWWTVVTSP